jgi:hypothetical protein
MQPDDKPVTPPIIVPDNALSAEEARIVENNRTRNDRLRGEGYDERTINIASLMAQGRFAIHTLATAQLPYVKEMLRDTACLALAGLTNEIVKALGNGEQQNRALMDLATRIQNEVSADSVKLAEEMRRQRQQPQGGA